MLNIALLGFPLMIHPEGLALYLGLALLMPILVTYLRVRSSPAYNQKPDQIVERRPGDRLLSAPTSALPEAEVDLDFALLSQAAYDKTPHGLADSKTKVLNPETELVARGWSIRPSFGENRGLPQKLQDAHEPACAGFGAVKLLQLGTKHGEAGGKLPVAVHGRVVECAGLATQRVIAQQPAAAANELIHEPLVGGIYDEMIMAQATLPPNASVPWHIHQDAHEIAYVLEGAIKVQLDKGTERVIKVGEGFHIDANLVHRGQAGASGARVLVVRLKPKDKPVMEMVPHD